MDVPIRPALPDRDGPRFDLGHPEGTDEQLVAVALKHDIRGIRGRVPAVDEPDR